MALNTAVFKTRALTSVVFVIVMLAGLLIDKWSFLLLFTFIHFGCWAEYQRLAGRIYPPYAIINPVHKYAVMLAGWGFMLLMTSSAYNFAYLNPQKIGAWFLYSFMALVVLAELIVSQGKPNWRSLLYSLLGLLYISLPWGLMISIRSSAFLLGVDLGYILVIIFVATIWINDTMAYIVGSLIGKTRLSKLSPQKTWEGTIGGAIMAVFTVSGLSTLISADFWFVFIMAVIAVLAGTAGDLLESWFKRNAEVKDSGHILPGHGGFLDRFDSLLIATPFVWLYLLVVGSL